MLHKEKYGKRERMCYARNPVVLDLPNLIAVQTKSFKWFLEEGIREVFEDISPIQDYGDSLVLEFMDYYMEDKPKYTEEEAKDQDTTYSCPMKVKVRLINKETEEMKEQEVFMGDFPLMTEKGTFIINGAERVVVNQLVRSPGVYYAMELDKSGTPLISSTVIPNRGAWIEYDSDSNNVVHVRIDRTRKLPATTLIRALIFKDDEKMLEVLGDTPQLRATLEKEVSKTQEDALIEIYKKLKPGDPAALESAVPLIQNLLFDDTRYDLAKVGRYKYNKKLAISSRIAGRVAAEDIENRETGEFLAAKGEIISKELATEIENAGINLVKVWADDTDRKSTR